MPLYVKTMSESQGFIFLAKFRQKAISENRKVECCSQIHQKFEAKKNSRLFFKNCVVARFLTCFVNNIAKQL